jgi:ankyrin repeat protein
MATIHPGNALAASSVETPSASPYLAECPFCLTPNAHECEEKDSWAQLPCSCCGNTLILMPASTGPGADEGQAGEEEISPDALLPSHQRRIGVIVASLASLLNYVLLSIFIAALFAEVKQNHDPYDLDDSLLSPLLLRANGWTALHLAAARGDLEQTRALVATGAAVDAVNERNRTPLYEAAKRGHTAVVSLLLEYGANPNRKAVQGYTPMVVAAERGHADTLAVLLSRGADLSVRCEGGDTALHRAVSFGHLLAVQVLLDRGMDVNLKSHGQTALELAEANEDQDLVGFLRAHGGKEFSLAKAHLARGNALHNNGQYTQALFAYADALAIDPEYAEAYLSRGSTLIQKGSHDEALITLQEAIRLEPTLADAYTHMSSIYWQRKQWAEGVVLWDGLLAIQPNNGRAYYERSLFRRAGGDAKGFMEDVQKACTFGYRKAC